MDQALIQMERLSQHLLFSPLETLLALALLACLSATVVVFFRRRMQAVGFGMIVLALVCLLRAPMEPVLWATFCAGFVLVSYARLTRRLWKETSPGNRSQANR